MKISSTEIRRYVTGDRIKALKKTEGGVPTIVDSTIFAQARKAAQDFPDYREDSIEELRQQLGDEIYQVDSSEVAEKLLGRSLVDQVE